MYNLIKEIASAKCDSLIDTLLKMYEYKVQFTL